MVSGVSAYHSSSWSICAAIPGSLPSSPPSGRTHRIVIHLNGALVCLLQFADARNVHPLLRRSPSFMVSVLRCSSLLFVLRYGLEFLPNENIYSTKTMLFDVSSVILLELTPGVWHTNTENSSAGGMESSHSCIVSSISSRSSRSPKSSLNSTSSSTEQIGTAEQLAQGALNAVC